MRRDDMANAIQAEEEQEQHSNNINSIPLKIP